MIEIKDVTVGYGRQVVLQQVSVNLKKGELTSVIGMNGSGKSTLLKAALGLLPTQRGQILLDGQPLGQLSRREIAGKAAYLSQGRSTPDMTVEQLVLHGRFPHLQYPRRYGKQDWEIAWGAMAQMGLKDQAQSPLAALSGGMRQKAYIAMALAQGTDYVLLDEPTTYLDICYQLELMNTLRDLADRGKGVVAVMHDLPMAFGFSDRILLLQAGRVLRCDRPERVYHAIEGVYEVALEQLPDGKSYAYRLGR